MPPDTAHAPPQRDARGRLLPGQTANRNGRPRTGTAFAEAVREHVDPVELIMLALDIARGLPAVRDLVWLRAAQEAKVAGRPPPPIEGVQVVWPSQPDRLAALTFLRDSGWQRPPQQTQLEVNATSGPPALLDYSRLSQAELDALEALHAKAAGVVTVGQAAGALETSSR